MATDLEQLAYFYTLRTEARTRVADSLNNRIKADGNRSLWDGVTLASIDKKALDAARLEWPRYYSSETHLGFEESWEKLFYRFFHNPAFFDLAIWQRIGDENVLQGLALGRPSSGKQNLHVSWIERSFAPNYFKGGILLPILACAEEYAKLLGSKNVILKNVVDPRLFAKYGFRPFGEQRKKTVIKEI